MGPCFRHGYTSTSFHASCCGGKESNVTCTPEWETKCAPACAGTGNTPTKGGIHPRNKKPVVSAPYVPELPSQPLLYPHARENANTCARRTFPTRTLVVSITPILCAFLPLPRLYTSHNTNAGRSAGHCSLRRGLRGQECLHGPDSGGLYCLIAENAHDSVQRDTSPRRRHHAAEVRHCQGPTTACKQQHEPVCT